MHGRRGDIDLVIAGPDAANPSSADLARVRAAVTADEAYPEAIAVHVRSADRIVYDADMTIVIPAGPDAELVRAEAVRRVTKAGAARMQIGGEIPPGYLAGAAYGDSVIAVIDHAPVVIARNAYVVPVPGSVSIGVEVHP